MIHTDKTILVLTQKLTALATEANSLPSSSLFGYSQSVAREINAFPGLAALTMENVEQHCAKLIQVPKLNLLLNISDVLL